MDKEKAVGGGEFLDGVLELVRVDDRGSLVSHPLSESLIHWCGSLPTFLMRALRNVVR